MEVRNGAIIFAGQAAHLACQNPGSLAVGDIITEMEGDERTHLLFRVLDSLAGLIKFSQYLLGIVFQQPEQKVLFAVKVVIWLTISVQSISCGRRIIHTRTGFRTRPT